MLPLKTILESANIADHLDEQQLAKIGDDLYTRIMADEESRDGWLKQNDMWIKMALQIQEDKSFPWPKSANVKYPLLTVSSIQFHARAQQSLLKGQRPVKIKVIGEDPDGQKADRADRVSKFLSYLVLHEMGDWQDDMDRLLMLLPIVGVCFKKVYWSPSKGQPISDLILPQDLIVNYYATDFERARKTQVIPMDSNEVKELQASGYYRDDVELDPARVPQDTGVEKEIHKVENTFVDDDIPHTIWESHCWLDIDDDGYKEPYIVTMDKDSKTVLRIAARIKDAKFKEDGETPIKFVGDNYFVRYQFLPDIHSKIYGMGLGTIMGPLNSAVNTITNQLIDAGTLATLQGGFLGRGARMARGGTIRFSPGEWKYVGSTGDDLRKSIFPLPVKEPSNVLFSLLGTLIDSGQKVGSVGDVMMGENPGQNQPFSTTKTVLEQGLTVFVGIYKRVYRALAKEYQRLYILIREMHPENYTDVLDDRLANMRDFETESRDISPAADPDMVTEMQKLLKAESLLQKLAAGLPINVQEATLRVLEAEEHENIEKLMQVPPPQPDFETQFKMQQHQDMMELDWAKFEQDGQISEAEILKDMAQAMVNFAKAQAVGDDMALKEAALELESQRDLANTFLERKNQDIEKRKVTKANEKPDKPTGQV